MSVAIPGELANLFDAETLQANSSTLVAVGADGCIRWMNDAWRAFATANEGAEVLERFGVGSSYLDGITDELRTFYQDVFTTVLSSQRIFEQDYECSSPDVLRQMHMRVLPLSDSSLLLEHSLLRAAPQDRLAHEAFAALYLSSSGLFVQCSNCRRMRRADTTQWDWVPAWVAKSPAQTSHGLCHVCLGYYFRPSTARRR